MSFTSPFALPEAVPDALEAGEAAGLAPLPPDAPPEPGGGPLADVEAELEADAGSVYEDDAELDPLSALEKYCRSDMPAQRLTYAAGIGAAAPLLEPSAVSGSLVSLLRELLGDVYADVRLTALQQVLPVARHLRSAGMAYQSDLEALWDIVQPLLLDADAENQELGAAVLAELSHLVAWGNGVVASQKLVWGMQRLQRVASELRAEGALAALRLITEVVAPREGSPLCFDAIEHFALSTVRDMAGYEGAPEVRQAVAQALPRFAAHMPGPVRAGLLPGILKALAGDSHWNVRAEVPELLVNLLAGQKAAAAAAAARGAAVVAARDARGARRPHVLQHPLAADEAAGGVCAAAVRAAPPAPRAAHGLERGDGRAPPAD